MLSSPEILREGKALTCRREILLEVLDLFDFFLLHTYIIIILFISKYIFIFLLTFLFFCMFSNIKSYSCQCSISYKESFLPFSYLIGFKFSMISFSYLLPFFFSCKEFSEWGVSCHFVWYYLIVIVNSFQPLPLRSFCSDGCSKTFYFILEFYKC